MDLTDDTVWSYTSPSAIDPEGDEFSITLICLNVTDDETFIYDTFNDTFGFEVFSSASEGVFVFNITLEDTKGASSSYSMLVNVTVNVPNLPPYFVEELPENITFDFTAEAAAVVNIYTSPQAVDPEDAEIRMNFIMSNSFTDSTGFDFLNFTVNEDDTFSIIALSTAPAG